MTRVLREGIETDPAAIGAPESPEYVLGNPDLPIAERRADIETAVMNHNALIIQGPPGSGKTTQVAQYLLELGIFGKITVTQPRIVAAREVSARVQNEITEAGSKASVGYYTSKESTPAPQHTQDIVFATDGKAAAQSLHEQRQPGDTTKQVLVIDEFHERNIYIDQLLAIAREKTDPQSKMYDPHFTVVIMSATMDTAKLEQYFQHAKPPVIEVAVPTFPVTRSETVRSAASVALEFAEKPGGKVLAFFADRGGITSFANEIHEKQDHKDQEIPVVPLHGQLSRAKQQKAFRKYIKGVIIAATNAAQTSITIPGIKTVVDTGKIREDAISYDISTGSEVLKLIDASQADVDQRKGRTGRTEPGEYLLCSTNGESPPVSYKDRAAYGTPAIKRVRLDSMLLQLKATGYELSDFQFIDPPTEQAVQVAGKRLFTLGALDKDGNITPRGQRMEQLPLDPEYACMIAFAEEEGYSDTVKQHLLDIAAIMQLKGILERAPKNQRWRDLFALHATREDESDFITQLNAYIEIMKLPEAEWGDYDIAEHPASQVEIGRVSLAKKMGMKLHDPAHVKPEDRDAVMTAIHAGQLNQIWKKRNGEWRLLLEQSDSFEQAKSSVAKAIGELATGVKFTLELEEKEIVRVQNVNLATFGRIEKAAKHLLVEKVDKSSVRYNREHQYVAKVAIMLGGVVLRSSMQPYVLRHDSPEATVVSKAHRKNALSQWERRASRVQYTLHTVTQAIDEPERAVYGTDPITNEPLVAWRGAKGWCVTKEIAVQSLEALQKNLAQKPQKAMLQELKDDIRWAETKLRALRKTGDQETVEAIGVLARKLKNSKDMQGKRDWLLEAKKLLPES